MLFGLVFGTINKIKYKWGGSKRNLDWYLGQFNNKWDYLYQMKYKWDDLTINHMYKFIKNKSKRFPRPCSNLKHQI